MPKELRQQLKLFVCFGTDEAPAALTLQGGHKFEPCIDHHSFTHFLGFTQRLNLATSRTDRRPKLAGCQFGRFQSLLRLPVLIDPYGSFNWG
jgi:hypothetical protein